MSPKPYYTDEAATLYLGDCREILPSLDLRADLIVTDPPYAETSLAWDRWPDGWPSLAATAASSMWCFGSMRMLLDRRDEFVSWKLSQDVVWEKHNGSGFAKDRFRRVHEYVTHWYRGKWANVHHQTPRVPSTGGHQGGPASRSGIAHTGTIARAIWNDDGTRLIRSVVKARSAHHAAIHPTEKPVELLDPLIRYGCPPGGLVLDPFAGSGSTLDAARQCGRRAIGIEAREDYAEAAARRLSAQILPAA